MASNASDARYVFYESPGTLRKTAAVAFAASIWHYEITTNHTSVRSLEKSHPRVRLDIEIPAHLRSLVNDCIDRMKKPLQLWVGVHYLRVFLMFTKQYEVLTSYFHFLVWKTDCTVDNEQTARKLIAYPQMDVNSKYKLACMYCFEKEIRSLWPDAIIGPELAPVIYEANCFVSYWDYRLQSEDNSERTVKDGSIEGNFILRREPDNCSSLVYYWSRLKPEDQFEKAVFIVEKYNPMYVRALIRAMTKAQFKRIVKKYAGRLLVQCIDAPDSVPFALQLWHHMKCFVTGANYAAMFKKILHSELDINHQHVMSILSSVGCRSSHTFEDDSIVNVSVASLLYDIWQDSPEHLKKHLLDNHLDEVLAKLCDVDHNATANLSRDVRLLALLLSKRTTQQNNSLWRKRWADIVLGANTASLGELMKLCFRNDREILNFKKSHMSVYSKIEDYCDTLVSNGQFEELDEFLRFCSPDRNVRAGLKRRIVWNPLGTMKFCVDNVEDAAKMQAFDDFISDISPTPEQRAGLKSQMIVSVENFNCLAIWLTTGAIRPIMNLIRKFLTVPKQLRVVKKNFKQLCQRIMAKGEFSTFDLQEWNEFLTWCTNGNLNQMEQMMKSVPIDTVFQKMFENSVGSIASIFKNNPDASSCSEDEDSDDESDGNGEGDSDGSDQWVDASEDESDSDDDDDSGSDLEFEFDDEEESEAGDYMDRFKKLDQLLMWYFGSETKIREFKLAKVNDPSLPEYIAKTIESKNKRVAEVVLKWFFNGDVQQIEAFKAAAASKRAVWSL